MFKKIWLSLAIVSTLLVSVPSANAAISILPTAGTQDCEEIKSDVVDFANNGSGDFNQMLTESQTQGEVFLACALKLGYIRFWMIPYYILYALQFVIGLAGLLVVLMVVVGGYYYIAGGITDDKEKGKHIITYALGGFVLVLTSWFIVNVILLALTS